MRWTKQPPQDTRVDWKNPLAQGLVYAKSFASIYTGDSVAKITPTVVDFTQELASPSQWGPMGYMTTTDLTSDFIDTKFYHDGRGEPNTIAVIWRTTDTEGTLISQRGDDTSNQIISQVFINNSPDQLIFRCDSQSDAVLYEGNEMWDGNWHIASVDWQTGVDCRCFFDGVERNTVTRLTGSDSTNVPALSIGHRWSTYPTVAGYTLGGDFAFAALWNRRLTAAEHVALAKNPWQVFEPKRHFALADQPEDHRVVRVPGPVRDPAAHRTKKRVALFSETGASADVTVARLKELVWNRGWQVTELAATDAENTSLAGQYDLIIIDQDVSSSSLGSKYVYADIPILLMESNLLDEHGFAAHVPTGTNSIVFTDHPIAKKAGLAGQTVTVGPSGVPIDWNSTNDSDALIVATATTGEPCIMAADPKLAHKDRFGRAFANRRVLYPFWVDFVWTDEIDKSIAASMDWLLEHPTEILIPIEEDLPEWGTFEKPWDGQPR